MGRYLRSCQSTRPTPWPAQPEPARFPALGERGAEPRAGPTRPPQCGQSHTPGGTEEQTREGICSESYSYQVTHLRGSERELDPNRAARKCDLSRAGCKETRSKLRFPNAPSQQITCKGFGWSCVCTISRAQFPLLLSTNNKIDPTGLLRGCDKMLCINDPAHPRCLTNAGSVPPPICLPGRPWHQEALAAGSPACLSPPPGRRAGRMFTLACQGPPPAWDGLNKHTRSHGSCLQLPTGRSPPRLVFIPQGPPPDSDPLFAASPTDCVWFAASS